MEHYTEKQYDDDLTVVADEYDDSFQTDNVDLFEFPSYDESPLARLKSLVLSIDWEITDEVLHQFNDELVDLKDVLAGEKIYLVYVQALEKISKYIYQEKADSNPNAIKLLLALYYNLEKMVSSDGMTEEEKRELLLEDVKKFEMLKKQIGREKKTYRPEAKEIYADEMQPVASMSEDGVSVLNDLKAIVLGIDWEITEVELEKLRDEVHNLEGAFAESRPKQIFLQGLGTLGAYIRLKKSDAHPDAFKLLHSFFAGLEKIVTEPMTLEEEKAVLFPEVEKFNAFKAIVGSKIKPSRDEDEDAEDYGDEGGPAAALAPALSGFAENEERGFQEEEEAAALGIPSSTTVENQIDRFFSEEDELRVDEMEGGRQRTAAAPEQAASAGAIAESRLETMFQAETAAAFANVDQEIALQGVNVETEADDDSGEERLPLEAGELAPALATLDEDAPADRRGGGKEPVHSEFAADVESRLDDFFKDFDVLDEKPEQFAAGPESVEEVPPEAVTPAAFAVEDTKPISDRDAALQGVYVETEDDDDSGEEPLAFLGEDLAPALAGEGESEELFVETAPADERAITAGPEEQETEPVLTFEEESEGSEGEVEPVISLEEEAELEVAFEGQPDVFEQETEPTIAFEEELTGIEADAEPVAAIEDQLDAFFTMEEEETPAPPQESTPLAPDSEVMDEKHEEMLQPPGSMFVMEVLEEAGEGDVVFELAEEEEEDVPAGEPFVAAISEVEEEPLTEKEQQAEAFVVAEEQPEPGGLFAPDEDFFAAGEAEFVAVPEEAEGVLEPVVEDESEFAAVFEEAEETVADETIRAEAAEGESSQVPVFAAFEGEQFAAAVPAGEGLTEEQPEEEEEFTAVAADTPLAGLRACVSSLGLALDDSILQGLFAEINTLRNRYVASPTAKIFLQLLSTVTQHIDQYRYESSSEAFEILQSISGSFEETIGDLQGPQAQDMVLREMTRVLLWQKGMLDRQAVSKGDEMTFAAPVRAESGQTFEEEEEISFDEEEPAEEFPVGFELSEEREVADEEVATEFPVDFREAPHPVEDEAEPGEDLTIEDAFAAGKAGAMDEDAYSELEQDLAGELLAPQGDEAADDQLAAQLRDIIRDEMEMIRKELQDSLDHLRKEMLDRDGR